MKVIQLPDVLHEYLVHVLEKHAGSGIHPEEGMAVSKLWEAITKNATHIDDADVRKMAAAGAPPTETPDEPESIPHSANSVVER
jgi:hypothetical protein